MRISVEARASAKARGGARAHVVIDAPAAAPSPDQTRGRIASVIAMIISIAGAVTSLPELSARLPARAVMALHFVAMVGTSAQPFLVTLAAALIAAIAERRRRVEPGAGAPP